MAVWEIRAEFTDGSRGWENVWHVDIGELADVPVAVLDAFIAFHRDNLLDIYILDRLVRRPAGSSDAFIEDLVGIAGTVVLGGAEPLPLFNVVKVLLGVAAGRPGLKFLRGLLKNNDIVSASGQIIAGRVDAVDSLLLALEDALVAAGCNLVVGAGKFASGGQAVSRVAMRQQHRKRRKSA